MVEPLIEFPLELIRDVTNSFAKGKSCAEDHIVAEMIQDKFGVTLGLTAIGRLLASLKITPQKPLRRSYERDPKAVDQWIKKTYPQLKKRAKKVGAAIFFLDEAGFTSEPNLGKTYGLKGETPIVQTTGQRQKVNAISAINAQGKFWSKVYTGNFNATRFVEFLKDFRRGGRGRIGPGHGRRRSWYPHSAY